MKYEERLTQWVADGASLILGNPTTAEEARQRVTVQFKKACIKLATLEDKIENGELISTVQDEQSEQEIAFFVKHNAEVRKQAVKEFAERVKMAFYYEFDELIPSIMADRIDELVKEVCGE